MKTVIFHSADFDGIFCREIARKFLGDKDVQYIGWNFGDPKVTLPGGGLTYILDLSPDCLDFDPDRVGMAGGLVWIDHHKTSIQKWPSEIPGYRIDGVAACRLAWQYFLPILSKVSEIAELPSKQDFIDRKVSEPLAVRLAGEYDVWDKKWMAEDPDILTFQYGLKAQREIPFALLLEKSIRGEARTLEITGDGQSAQCFAQQSDALWLREASFLLPWEGLTFLAFNTVERGSSKFLALDNPTNGHDALLAFGRRCGHWTVSLYHAKHRTDLDLSAIAVKHGGGGHKGACGFTCKELPFEL